MLQLKQDELARRAQWQQAGIAVPAFDRAAMRRKTADSPVWLHFGAGNIFRGYIADLQQTILENGNASAGIVAAETFDAEIVDRAYAPYDHLTLLAVLCGDGSFEKRVIASIAESIVASPARPAEWDRLCEIAVSPGLQMISFTVTEKGYAVANASGEPLADARADMENGPDAAVTVMGVACALLYRRYRAGALPVAMVSMDNCSHNGDKLKAAITAIASEWVSRGICESGFADYLNNRDQVGFPYTMIDKITPNPSQTVLDLFAADGVEGLSVVHTAKGSHVAPFVNAERAQYLVMEDWFPNGRPALQEAGVYITDRETVDRVEKMKVCTCLNPLHTALAIFGCLLGYQSISSEMADADLRQLVHAMGVHEGLPVVVDPGIIRPEDFLHTVLTERLPNPNLPDTPQRIACDTSQKMAIRFGETLKAYRDDPALDPKSLKHIPLVIAGWCRYLLGKDDDWNPFPCSPDPLLQELCGRLADIQLGQPPHAGSGIRAILADNSLFGVDLYEIGIGELVEEYFCIMIREKGAIRRLLHQIVSQ